MENTSTSRSFRIDDEDWKVLEELADLDERPVSHLIRLALRQYVSRRAAARAVE